MTAHLHTVMKLEQSVGGMSWFQYDWRACRETCAAGASLSLGRRDPWQLLTRMPGRSGHLDPFDPMPQGLKAERHQILAQPKFRQPANQIKQSRGQPSADKVECADSTIEPQLDAIWKRLHFHPPMHSV